ncbi:MAG: hypothetical protein ABI896_10010 [Actinomycetota bacterium]
MIELLDDEKAWKALDDPLDFGAFVPGKHDEPLRVAADGLVLRESQLHLLEAILPAAFTDELRQECGLFGVGEAFRNFVDSLVDLSEEDFVSRRLLLLAPIHAAGILLGLERAHTIRDQTERAQARCGTKRKATSRERIDLS